MLTLGTRNRRLLLASALLLRLAADAPAASASDESDESDDSATRARWRLFPAERMTTPALADPNRTGFGVSFLHATSVGIPDSGETRFLLELGGTFALLRRESAGRPDRAWQLGIVAGFAGQFDVDRGYDNVGWDGVYGLVAEGALGDETTLRVGAVHTSSHLGDELVLRTGRGRLDYTREELRIELYRRIGERFRVYGAAGWAYELRNRDFQEPGRLQAGVEWTSAPGLFGGRAGTFAALDLGVREEQGWSLDAALQAGLLVPAGDRRWRLGVLLYDGRVPIGELSEDAETYVGLGLWLDL